MNSVLGVDISVEAHAAAALGSGQCQWRLSGLGVVHGSRRSSLRVEIGVGARAHAHATRDAREKRPVKVSQNPINNVLIDCMNSFTTLRRERRQTEVSPSQSLFRFSLNLELSG